MHVAYRSWWHSFFLACLTTAVGNSQDFPAASCGRWSLLDVVHCTQNYKERWCDITYVLSLVRYRLLSVHRAPSDSFHGRLSCPWVDYHYMIIFLAKKTITWLSPCVLFLLQEEQLSSIVHILALFVCFSFLLRVVVMVMLRSGHRAVCRVQVERNSSRIGNHHVMAGRGQWMSGQKLAPPSSRR